MIDMDREKSQDIIVIKNLELFCFHGVFPEEKEKGQLFIVSLKLFLNLQPAGNEDDLTKTINYADVCEKTHEFMTNNIFDLLETAAEKLALLLLTEYPLMDKINVEIKKPDAPINLPFEYVAVEITRQWHSVCLGVGSNIGDKLANISFAVQQIKESPVFKSLIISDIIETKPYGPVPQDDFKNACITVKTVLLPFELLSVLKEIEKKSGRTPTERWGPRTLDLDILLYDDLIMNDDQLTIPHVDMHNRRFVLEPLSTISPYTIHPILKKSIKELIEQLPL